MSVEPRHIIFYGSASMSETDSAADTGGAVDKTSKVVFTDIVTTGTLLFSSTDAADDGSVYVTGRDASGALINEQIELGAAATTPVAGSSSFERIIKAVVSGTTLNGDLALYSTHQIVTATAQASSPATVVLSFAASSAVDDFYRGYTLRMIDGSGDHAEIVKYTGSTRTAYLRKGLGAAPDADDDYSIYPGITFENGLGESAADIATVTRPFYNASASPTVAKFYYDKFFVFNLQAAAGLTLSGCTLTEVASGLYASASFGVENALNGTATTVNRRTSPSTISAYYDNSDGAIAAPNSQNFSPNSSIGIWLKLQLPIGQAAANGTWSLQINGQTT